MHGDGDVRQGHRHEHAVLAIAQRAAHAIHLGRGPGGVTGWDQHPRRFARRVRGQCSRAIHRAHGGDLGRTDPEEHGGVRAVPVAEAQRHVDVGQRGHVGVFEFQHGAERVAGEHGLLLELELHPRADRVGRPVEVERLGDLGRGQREEVARQRLGEGPIEPSRHPRAPSARRRGRAQSVAPRVAFAAGKHPVGGQFDIAVDLAAVRQGGLQAAANVGAGNEVAAHGDGSTRAAAPVERGANVALHPDLATHAPGEAHVAQLDTFEGQRERRGGIALELGAREGLEVGIALDAEGGLLVAFLLVGTLDVPRQGQPHAREGAAVHAHTLPRGRSLEGQLGRDARPELDLRLDAAAAGCHALP